MAQATRFRAAIRSGRDAAIGDVLMMQAVSFDPTATTAATTITLPQGARLAYIILDGGGTGGASPTVDIGTTSDDDAFLAEGVADGNGVLHTVGHPLAGVSFTATALTADTIVFAGVGASAAGGGTVEMMIAYWVVFGPELDPSSE